jgi:hypothetical protein
MAAVDDVRLNVILRLCLACNAEYVVLSRGQPDSNSSQSITAHSTREKGKYHSAMDSANRNRTIFDI